MPTAAVAVPASTLAGVALVLWGWSDYSTTKMSSLGLVSVVDWRYPVGVLLILGAYFGELRQARPRTIVMWGLLGLAVVAIFGLAPAVEHAARLPTTYIHAGFVNYIADHGAVLHHYDARFSWPGFFAAAAVVMRTAGLKDPTPLLAWAPVFFMLAYLVPLRSIADRIGLSDRATWLALLLFVIGNWTEEEYFSPQAFAYLLALILLAISVKSADDTQRPLAARIGLLASWLLIAVAITASHQLTPFAATVWLAALWIGRRSRWPALTVLLPLIGLSWLAFAARDYWVGHKSTIFGGVGSIHSTVSSGVGSRLDGSPTHHVIVELRIVLTAVLLLFAFLGALRRARADRDWLLMAGVLLPFGLVALQSYGGEIFIRVDLFVLPFAALGAAEALCALAALRIRWVPALATPVLAVMSVVAMAAMLVIARGGNDPYVAMTSADVNVAATATNDLPTGSAIAFVTGYVPLRASRIGQIGEQSLQTSCPDPATVAACVSKIDPGVLMLTAGQQSYGEIVQGWPSGWLTKMQQQLVDSGEYRVWISQGDATVLVSRSGPETGAVK